MTIVDLFRCFRHVRELANEQNAGARVESIQKWGGGKKGESWCCYLATQVLDMWFCGYLSVESPIPRTGSCDDVLEIAAEKGWLRDTPAVGDLFLFLRDPDGPNGPRGNDDAHHIGMVTAIGNATFDGIAGNTSEDGRSSNGTGTFEHAGMAITPRVKFVRYPGERTA